MIIKVSPKIDIDKLRDVVVRKIMRAAKGTNFRRFYSYYWSNEFLDPAAEDVFSLSTVHGCLSELRSKAALHKIKNYEGKLAFDVVLYEDSFQSDKPWLRFRVWNLSAIKDVGNIEEKSNLQGDCYEACCFYSAKKHVSSLINKIFSELSRLRI